MGFGLKQIQFRGDVLPSPCMLALNHKLEIRAALGQSKDGARSNWGRVETVGDIHNDRMPLGISDFPAVGFQRNVDFTALNYWILICREFHITMIAFTDFYVAQGKRKN